MKQELTLNEYQRRAMTTRMDSCDNDTYMLFGFVAEVGELADKVAKYKRKEIITVDKDVVNWDSSTDYSVANHILLRDAMLHELGDCLWFIAGITARFGCTLEDIAQLNLDKLAERKAKNTIVSHKDH